MELKDYLQILIRWIRVLLLCAFLGAGGGYAASRLEQPSYVATTKILVTKDISDQSSRFAAMNNQQFIDANIQLLSSASVVDEASKRLDFEINLKELGSVQQVLASNVIKITMEDSDPQRAAAIANMLVEVLIDQNTRASGYASNEENLKKNIARVEDQITTLQDQFNQISDERLQGQLEKVNGQISALQDDILKLAAEIGPLASLGYPTAEQSSQLVEKQANLAQLQSLLAQYQQIRINLEYVGKPTLNSSDLGGDLRLQLLQSTLDRYQKIYLDLIDNLESVQLVRLSNTQTIDQIEKATPPKKPIRPQPLIYTMLGGIIGLLLAIGVIFIVTVFLKKPQGV